MRHWLVITCITLILCSLPFAVLGFLRTSAQTHTTVLGTSSRTPEPTLASTEFTAEKLYLLINAYRVDQALSPLRQHTALEQSADLKVRDMISNNYWQHQDRSATYSWPFLKQVGYEYTQAGENLSFAINSPWGVFQSWVESPTHNEQLLTPEYQDMGVAIDCDTYQRFAEQPCIVVLHLGRQ